MPKLTLTFFVLTLDKTGHVTWPIAFDSRTKAALRKQARTLMQKMIADPLNPMDNTMLPALTGMGESLFRPAPKRMMVEAGATWMG